MAGVEAEVTDEARRRRAEYGHQRERARPLAERMAGACRQRRCDDSRTTTRPEGRTGGAGNNRELGTGRVSFKGFVGGAACEL